MPAVEILTMLSVSAVNPLAVRGRARSGLSKSELAGLLVGLDDVAVCFALAKYCGDSQCLDKLHKYVQAHITGLFIAEGWRDVDVFRLSKVVVNEVVAANPCRICRGADEYCLHCGGSGVDKSSARFLAKLIGVSQSNYVRVWQQRFKMCCQYLYDIDNEVNRLVFKNAG